MVGDAFICASKLTEEKSMLEVFILADPIDDTGDVDLKGRLNECVVEFVYVLVGGPWWIGWCS